MVAGVIRSTKVINNDYMMTSCDVIEYHVMHSHNSLQHHYSTISPVKMNNFIKCGNCKKHQGLLLDMNIAKRKEESTSIAGLPTYKNLETVVMMFRIDCCICIVPRTVTRPPATHIQYTCPSSYGHQYSI